MKYHLQFSDNPDSWIVSQRCSVVQTILGAGYGVHALNGGNDVIEICGPRVSDEAAAFLRGYPTKKGLVVFSDEDAAYAPK